MIRWRLRVVMAERCMSNEELAKRIKLHRVSVSNLKNAQEMPRISGKTLNSLCEALHCTPADLIEYTPDSEVKPP